MIPLAQLFFMEKNDLKNYDVPPEGSLGLLALGAQGIIAWRKKRKETGMEEKLLAIREELRAVEKKRKEQIEKRKQEKQNEQKIS